jgi:hypothetical protein
MLRRMLSVLAAASQPQRVESNRCGASGHAQGPVLTTQGRGASDLRLHLCSECADVVLCADSGRLSRTASGKSVAERPGRDGTLARPAVAAASATCCVCVCVRLHKRGGGRSKISAMGASRPLSRPLSRPHWSRRALIPQLQPSDRWCHRPQLRVTVSGASTFLARSMGCG